MDVNKIKNHLITNKQESDSLKVMPNIITMMSETRKDGIKTTMMALFDTNFNPPRLIKAFSDNEYEVVNILQ